MFKLKKCLYIIDLLSRRGSMSMKEINEQYQYSSLYGGEISSCTFARYKDYISETFPCYIEYNSATNELCFNQGVLILSSMRQVEAMKWSIANSSFQDWQRNERTHWLSASMPIVSGLIVPKMRPTNHFGNIWWLKPGEIFAKHHDYGGGEN